jgi:pyridoxal phosphate enzyme (YggS family)
MGIRENTRKLLKELPDGVELVAAAKSRTAAEVREAIDSGIKIIGQNYLQEAEAIYPAIGNKARWHFIGHLQKNKVKKAVRLFDMIETVDSVELAQEIDRRCALVRKVMPVLVEINSGREKQKAGVVPEKAEELIKAIARLANIKVMGLMTMGPRFGNPEDSRPYFITTRKIFERIKALKIANVEMKYLSMGMTNSYPVALEEGANLVRIGTLIFGERE